MGRRETSDTLVLLQFFASTTKTTRKPYPLGGTNLYGLYKRVEPAPALVGLKMGGEHFHILIRKWLKVSQRT